LYFGKDTGHKKVGLLDNRFFAYFEDVDWSIRMTNQGYKLGVVPESIIYHHIWKHKEKQHF